MKRIMFILLMLFGGLLGEVEADPSIVGSLDIPWACGVYVSGSYAYVTALGIEMVDISNPAEPIIVNSTGETVFSINDIHISGNYAYVAGDTSGLLIMDISDFGNISLVGSVETPHRARSVSVSDNYAYIATWGDSDLAIVDISNPQKPALEITQAFPEPTWAYGVCISDYRAYIAGGIAGLHVLDVTNPLLPIHIGSVVNKGTPNPAPYTYDTLCANGAFISGACAFVADSSGLQIIDITDLQNPVLLGSVDISPSGASDVFVSGSYAYVTANTFEGEFFIIDVSDFTESPTTPVEPSITISLNKSEYYPGDNMEVTLTTSAGTGNNSWDIYVGLILPDNSFQFMTFEPSFSIGLNLLPARPLKPITTESMTILEITMPEGLPPGNWQWLSALGKDNLNKISNISQAAFTLGN